jgi:long-chain acyl-CoA synthetase
MSSPSMRSSSGNGGVVSANDPPLEATVPWLSAYPDGLGRTIEVRHPHMLALWDDTVRRHGDRTCVLYFGAAFTYREIEEESSALAAELLAAGLRADDRVGIMLQNDPQWPVALLATWKAGGIAVSLSPMMKSRELRYQLDDASVTVLICLETLYNDVARDAIVDSSVQAVYITNPSEWLGRSPIDLPAEGGDDVTVCSLRGALEARRASGANAARLDAKNIAVLTYTSGTTGPPKGAMITHGGLVHNSQVVAKWFSLGADDPVLGLAPLFHVTGLVMHMGVSWFAGSAVVLGHRFDPDEIFDSIERHKPTFTIAAITAFVALLNHPRCQSTDLSSLRVVASGGAPVHIGTVNRFREVTGHTISTVYGLTETTSPSHLTPLGSEPLTDTHSGILSVGVPVPGATVEIVDLATGAVLGSGETGELVISGPMVVPGYWNQPEQSLLAIPGGRLYTGDVGFMNDEGWFFVIDRKKDLIVASGYKVWPREVEEVLCLHPGVREAAVAGKPDPYRGETVVAWVVAATGWSLGEAELIAFCRERLAAYKYPREISMVGELPKTSSGKVLRRELRL